MLSAAFYSLGHGTNDAQKTMGIIAGAFFTVPAYRHLVSDANGQLSIPFWIVLMAHAAIALGTLSGGWRIVHTVGSKITKLQPLGGFAAETAGAITLFRFIQYGHPCLNHSRHHRGYRWSRISTEHTCSALVGCRTDRVGVDLYYPCRSGSIARRYMASLHWSSVFFNGIRTGKYRRQN